MVKYYLDRIIIHINNNNNNNNNNNTLISTVNCWLYEIIIPKLVDRKKYIELVKNTYSKT